MAIPIAFSRPTLTFAPGLTGTEFGEPPRGSIW